MGYSDTEPIVYLDYNATAPIRPEALSAMALALTSVGNASSVHVAGRAASERVEAARRAVADLLGCGPGEITFTSGATEANNIALRSAAAAGGGSLVISAVEHPAIMETAHTLAALYSRRLHVVGVDAHGVLRLDELHAALDDNPSVVSVMAANNETGIVNDLHDIIKATHDAGALFHTDATQLVGRLPINVRDLELDMLSLSAHKFGGPQGVGALFTRRTLPIAIQPIAYGGGHERGRRPGTHNVAGIVGLGAAAKAAMLAVHDEALQTRALRDRLEEGVLAAVPGARINGRRDRRLPGVSSMTFFGAPSDAVLAAMANVAASVGSACTSGTIEPSHVLLAMGLPRDEAECTIRFSIGYATAATEIDRAIDSVGTAVRRVREAIDRSHIPATRQLGRITSRDA